MSIMMVIVALLLIYNFGDAVSFKPNVCKQFIDYFYIENNTNCWYNPDVDATVPEMVTNKGYPFEKYKIMAKDGYITDLFRIPRPKPNKGVFYLLHPATVTSAIWIDKGINGSLGFILYDAGYDVWMGNSRGSDYGNEHVSMTQNDTKYWDFSFHEMAMYDLPKQLEFVKKTTGNRAVFVGHSMGSTAGYIYAAMKPEHAKNHVRLFVLTSPGGFFERFKLPFVEFLSGYVDFGYRILKATNYLRVLSKSDSLSQLVLNFCRTAQGLNVCPAYIRLNFGIASSAYDPDIVKSGKFHKVASRDDELVKLVLQICTGMPAGTSLCSYVSKFILGINDVVIDPAYVPVAFAQYPGGVPAKAYIHYGQWLGYKSLRFRMFNYGKAQNRRIYKSDLPPRYPFHKITTPVLVVGGANDWLSSPEGVDEFYKELPEEAKIYGKIIIPEYNHGDVLIASDCAEVVYKPLLKFFDSLDLVSN